MKHNLYGWEKELERVHDAINRVCYHIQENEAELELLQSECQDILSKMALLKLEIMNNQHAPQPRVNGRFAKKKDIRTIYH